MLFRILKDFAGSQDGATTMQFFAGTEVEISDYLAPHISAWAVPVGVEIQNKAVITDGAPRRGRPPKLAASKSE